MPLFLFPRVPPQSSRGLRPHLALWPSDGEVSSLAIQRKSLPKSKRIQGSKAYMRNVFTGASVNPWGRHQQPREALLGVCPRRALRIARQRCPRPQLRAAFLGGSSRTRIHHAAATTGPEDGNIGPRGPRVESKTFYYRRLSFLMHTYEHERGYMEITLLATSYSFWD